MYSKSSYVSKLQTVFKYCYMTFLLYQINKNEGHMWSVFFLSFFKFLPHPQHAEVPGLGIRPQLQQ